MKKVLLIEDDIDLQRTYQDVLTDEGIRIVVAGNGTDGLNFAKTHKPDLILLDIMLPGGINGFDVLENLKRDVALSPIPVIVLSNLDSEKKTATTIGAADYLVKANTPIPEVVKMVKKHLKI